MSPRGASAQPSRFQPGAIVWGARLVRPLDGGGMAELWLAERLESGGEVVIKFLSDVGDEGPDEIDRAAERFRLEAHLAAQLGDKTKHIVQIHDVGQLGDTPYLVMEHVPGRSLEAILRERKTLPPAWVAELIEQVAEALSVVHAALLVHRDVKPANLLVTETAGGGIFVKLADFGIAKAKDTSDALVAGTPAYASPEQLYQEELDGRSDLWSLAVVAYEALTGDLPFGSSAAGKATPELVVAVCTAGFAPASSKRRALPRPLDAWFDRALAKDRVARFQDAREMAAAFRLAIAGWGFRQSLVALTLLAVLGIVAIVAVALLR